MGEAAKGEGFSSSLVYALIKISACGTIVLSTRKKFVRVEINFYTNLTHAQSVCTRLSFPSRPAPSGEPGFEARNSSEIKVQNTRRWRHS